jgi:hypothetical protein
MTNLECPCRRGASGSYSGEGSLTQGLLCHSGAVQCARDILDRALGKPVPRTESSAAEVRSAVASGDSGYRPHSDALAKSRHRATQIRSNARVPRSERPSGTSRRTRHRHRLRPVPGTVGPVGQCKSPRSRGPNWGYSLRFQEDSYFRSVDSKCEHYGKMVADSSDGDRLAGENSGSTD